MPALSQSGHLAANLLHAGTAVDGLIVLERACVIFNKIIYRVFLVLLMAPGFIFIQIQRMQLKDLIQGIGILQGEFS